MLIVYQKQWFIVIAETLGCNALSDIGCPLQAGTWAAIGFPISDADARHQFYSYANW
jgi:hypothetical protein